MLDPFWKAATGVLFGGTILSIFLIYGWMMWRVACKFDRDDKRMDNIEKEISFLKGKIDTDEYESSGKEGFEDKSPNP